MYILDLSEEKDTNSFIINNNIFFNNKGNYSGGIFLDSSNQFSNYNFTNNIFSNNSNNAIQGIGKDAFLKFDNPPQNWTSDNIQDIIKDLFNNSISDARAGSIYYEMNHDNITYPGNITLPDHIQPSPEPIPEKKHNTKYIIIGVIVGFVIFILTAFAIFIVFRKVYE